MHCPNDNTLLQMTSREGIEIDYCPSCRGVWLDRGELDKLIERSNAAAPMPVGSGRPQSDSDHRRFDDDDDHYEERYGDRRHDSRQYDERRHYDGDHHGHGHHKKKEGFLGDLFDF